MVTLLPVQIEGHIVMAVEVKLPKTNLVALYTDRGYIMCGALDVGLLNEKLAEREILAGRAVGVRSVSDLLEAPLESVTIEAEKQGIYAGMKGRDALLRMI
ncbi:YunC family protein [Paenibacillus sp. JSM ZJ436]|uniref:DUF1805 domain-containing protein n=1 Tax=Paenibacillus algicola TaxID=2565926 RepID=A0A4P8XLI7_9BACL|nr:DUF1805 domain-containing protein [Paenibacillus algicola]QCT03616.1 hypothetical protein E6C60_2905 [Paenibacillus algicola]